MLRVGWLWQVDLDEFTARLHQIALTKPAWVPKIRAVVVDTLAKRVGADGAEPEPDAVTNPPPTNSPASDGSECPDYTDVVALQVTKLVPTTRP